MTRLVANVKNLTPIRDGQPNDTDDWAAILAEFAKVKIEGDIKQLKDRLKRKSDLLKRAAETFLSTAELGVAELLAHIFGNLEPSQAFDLPLRRAGP